MTTLLDYTRIEFPHHTLEVWQSDGWTVAVLPGEGDRNGSTAAQTGSLPGRSQAPRQPTRPPAHPDDLVNGPTPDSLRLVDHTVVAHVIGADAAIDLLRRMDDAGWTRSAAVLVRPVTPSVAGTGRENPESVTDLPDRRVAAVAALGALVGAVVVAAIGFLIADEPATGFIGAAFGAVIGAVIGAMVGGLGRHAGEQAWSQPHAPGRTMGVVATFVGDERALADAVHVMELADPHVIRVVNAQGAWRAPLA